MIFYRSFRNSDPPALARLWTKCFTQRGAINTDVLFLFDAFVLSKIYFESRSIEVATTESGQVVGFVLGGFGPGENGTAINRSVGVICLLGVDPGFRRKGIATELVRRFETHLKEQGCQEVYAGPYSPFNPFTFGIYGGSNSPGFLDSDPLARSFFLNRGYTSAKKCKVLQLNLEKPLSLADGRSARFRLTYEIEGAPLHPAGYWKEAVLGPVEIYRYRLRQQSTKEVVGFCDLWEMNFFGQRWEEIAIGFVDLQINPEYRHQGLGKYLISQLLRHLKDQFFTVAEIQVDSSNSIGLSLFQQLGFQTIDQGQQFRKL